jgi:hypothetical protein
MNMLQKFILEFGPQHFAAILPVQLIVNCLAMWFVVNVMMDLKERVSIVKCGLATLALWLVSAITIGMLFVPLPFMIVLAGLVWILGSVAVIHGVFGIMERGAVIFILYIITLLGISMFIRQVIN